MNKHYLKWILAFAGAIVIVLLFRGFAFTSCLIPSAGMENSLFQGERILVSKWSYGLRVPLMSLSSYHRWNECPVKRQDIVVFNNPAGMQQPVIDQREVYISRCIGVPGDTIMIDSLFSAVSSAGCSNPDKKKLYSYPASRENLVLSLMKVLSIPNDGPMGSNDSMRVRSFSRYEYYLLQQAMNVNDQDWLQPQANDKDYNLKPLIVPGKGKALRVYPWNITLLRNTLVMHEGRQAEIRNDTLYVDGKPTQHCYFTKDYYWMASNNTINLSDSRLFGFVPQDHVIGKVALVWFSKDTASGIFNGYRWDRIFHSVK